MYFKLNSPAHFEIEINSPPQSYWWNYWSYALYDLLQAFWAFVVVVASGLLLFYLFMRSHQSREIFGVGGNTSAAAESAAAAAHSAASGTAQAAAASSYAQSAAFYTAQCLQELVSSPEYNLKVNVLKTATGIDVPDIMGRWQKHYSDAFRYHEMVGDKPNGSNGLTFPFSSGSEANTSDTTASGQDAGEVEAGDTKSNDNIMLDNANNSINADVYGKSTTQATISAYGQRSLRRMGGMDEADGGIDGGLDVLDEIDEIYALRNLE
jgi:hypothetical protein